MSERGDGMT